MHDINAHIFKIDDINYKFIHQNYSTPSGPIYKKQLTF